MGKGSSQGSEIQAAALHTVGSRVWLYDEGHSDKWVKGEVMAMTGTRLRVRLEDGGEERDVGAGDVPLQNPSKNGVEVRRRSWWQRCCLPGTCDDAASKEGALWTIQRMPDYVCGRSTPPPAFLSSRWHHTLLLAGHDDAALPE